MKSKTESFYPLRAKRPQVVTRFLYENNNENKTAGDAQMRGEWDGNNDRSRALRVSFRSFLFFSTNRQVHRPVMILTWNALTTLNYLCFTAGYTP